MEFPLGLTNERLKDWKVRAGSAKTSERCVKGESVKSDVFDKRRESRDFRALSDHRRRFFLS